MVDITPQMNKVVVAVLDGQRLKGYVFNFSALREDFRLFPDQTSRQDEGRNVLMKDLKAVFFVKEFAGNPGYQETSEQERPAHGRKIEVKFSDGETVVGLTEGYNPQKLGFFIFPVDPQSNNLRIFVINKNVRQVRML